MNEIKKRAPAHVVMLADLRASIENYQSLSARHGQGWVDQKSMSDWFGQIKDTLHTLDRIILPLKALPGIISELQGHHLKVARDEALCKLLDQTLEKLAEYGIELTPVSDDTDS